MQEKDGLSFTKLIKLTTVLLVLVINKMVTLINVNEHNEDYQCNLALNKTTPLIHVNGQKPTSWLTDQWTIKCSPNIPENLILNTGKIGKYFQQKSIEGTDLSHTGKSAGNWR